MRLLIFGGTAWLGRTLTDEALARGHDVVCVARGSSGRPRDAAEFVRYDREDQTLPPQLTAAPFDAVLDLATEPAHVARAVAQLAPAGRYAYVSSVSAYADQATPDQDEAAPLAAAIAPGTVVDFSTYGGAKATAEAAVLAGYGDARSIIVRPGLIAGPGDTTDRTGYWPWRFARAARDGQAVVVPDAEQAVQLIDVRDLAAFLLDLVGAGDGGVFNAVGERMTLAATLGLARAAAGFDGEVVAMSGGWLHAHGVSAFSGLRSLPLWLGDDGPAGFMTRSSARAEAAGLRRRPLADTLADTLAWELVRPEPFPRRAGMSDAEARHLLETARAELR